MARKEDCWAGIMALTDKTQDNIKLVLNHYGYDTFARKVKFLEDQLGINSEKEGAEMKDRFAMICEYIKETNSTPKPKAKAKKPTAETIKNVLGLDDNVKIVEVPSGLSRESIAEFIRQQMEAQEEEEHDSFEDKLLSMMNDFSDEERAKIIDTISKLHKKYEYTPEQKAYMAACDEVGVRYESINAMKLFKAGIRFGRGE